MEKLRQAGFACTICTIVAYGTCLLAVGEAGRDVQRKTGRIHFAQKKDPADGRSITEMKPAISRLEGGLVKQSASAVSVQLPPAES